MSSASRAATLIGTLLGTWFGAGFHEDGLQAGLAVAEQLGGVRRPWNVAGESSRIHVGDTLRELPKSWAQAAE